MKRAARIALLSAPTLAVAALATAWWLTTTRHDTAPYAGLDEREIKALAPEQVEGLRRGEGLGYALAAELNDVPGPKHALELDLGLTDEQRGRVETVFERMNADARAMGEELIAAERALDAALAGRKATPDEISKLTAEAATIEGRLRARHLVAHLETDPILTPDQRAAYAAARGYAHTGHANVHTHAH